MRMNDLLTLDKSDLIILLNILCGDKAYINYENEQYGFVLMEDLGRFKAWDELSLDETQEILSNYNSKRPIIPIELTDDQWRWLLRLLAEDVVFMNYYNPLTDNYDALSVAILTNDIFHYAADAEAMSYDELERVYTLWEQSIDAVIRYVAEKRGYRPLRRYIDRMVQEGIDMSWTLTLRGNN